MTMVNDLIVNCECNERLRMIKKDVRSGILFLKERIKYDKKSIKRTGIFDVIPCGIS